MKMTHFETPADALEFALDTVLWDMREDLAQMEGPDAESYTETEYNELADKIADVEALTRH